MEQFQQSGNKIRDAVEAVVVKPHAQDCSDDKPYKEAQSILAGSSAAVFAGDDPVGPCKQALVDFAKTHEPVKIKGGMVSDSFVDSAQVEALSKMPSREQLYATILGGIKAPASNILGGIKGLHQKLYGLINAYKDKLEGQQAA